MALLGPILFLPFINDLPLRLCFGLDIDDKSQTQISRFWAFADDTNLIYKYTITNSFNNVDILQEDLNKATINYY